MPGPEAPSSGPANSTIIQVTHPLLVGNGFVPWSNMTIKKTNEFFDHAAMHTAFNFAAPLSAAQLIIQIDHGNLAEGMQDNIGIDNIRFGQNPPAAVPIPPALWLFGSGLLGLIGIARRKKAA
jgi:hypothetical protein